MFVQRLAGYAGFSKEQDTVFFMLARPTSLLFKGPGGGLTTGGLTIGVSSRFFVGLPLHKPKPTVKAKDCGDFSQTGQKISKN